MLLTIAAILLVLWLLGVVIFKVTAGLIHLFVIVAVVVAAVHFFRRRSV
jgi:hypothetical protein